MRKKLALLLIIISAFVFGCGGTKTIEFNNSSEEYVDTKTYSNENIDNKQNQSVENLEDEINNTGEDDEEVSVILSMISFDDSETIEDYVVKMNEENGSDSFAVYDENHYSLTIKESERQEVLRQYNSGEFIEESFNEIFSDEQYNSAFTKMDYDELFQNVTFYADKEKYDSAGLAVFFGPVFISYAYSDIIQAYSLIPVDERACTVKIVDDETNEVIYDSSSEE